MAIPEKTPSESLRENDEARLARIAKKNAKARERIAIDALTKLKQLFERDAAGCESIPNGYLVSRKLIDFADRCAQALNGDITDGHGKRDATDVVFEIQTDLNREATGWEKDYFPVSDLYNGLAKECSKEWHRAIAREKRGEQSDNSIPPTVSHFGNPPTRKSELFEVVEALVNKHFKKAGALPTKQNIWDSLKDKCPDNYDTKTKVILDLGRSKDGLDRPSLYKNLRQWKYPKVD
jgi:hypothetical protein